MKFILKVTSLILLMAFASATSVWAEPKPIPRIDWEQFDDSRDTKGDHVVGEELC